MVKRTLFLSMILIFSISTNLLADSVNKNLAKQIAKSKLIQLSKDSRFSIKTPLKSISNSENVQLFYVINLSPQGYIIVSGNTDLPPVIAYSFTNNYSDKSIKNNVLEEILTADIELRLKNISKIPEDFINKRNMLWKEFSDKNYQQNLNRSFQQWPPEGSTPTGGWLEDNWTQNAPYNNFCPIDNVTGNRSIAGCPAVAMAQILNFLKTTQNTTFDDTDDYYHNYSGRQYWIDNDCHTYDFPSFPEMNAYLETLEYHFQNQIPLTDDDKAVINFACGVAMHQVYTSTISGTFGVSQAFMGYEKFNFSEIELLDENSPDLYEKLSQNMMDAFPAHLAVIDPPHTMGHNIVVDGYNTDDYYHINFGWGGSYNGWYLIPDEIPYGLTVIEGLIVNIFPENQQSSQTISLEAGFQFSSSHIQAENSDMMLVLSEILNDNLVFVRNSLGQTLRKIGPNWVNGIGNWNSTEGYLFKMNQGDDFTIEGIIVDDQTPINLEAGYQFVSYLPLEEMDAMSAFGVILNDNLEFIRSSTGANIMKIGPNWVNGIGNCSPDEGYLIKMNAADVLIYPLTK